MTGDLLFTATHSGSITSAEWNTDETRLLTWSAGTAKVWLVDFDQWILMAEEKLIPELFTNEDREQFFLPKMEPTATATPDR